MLASAVIIGMCQHAQLYSIFFVLFLKTYIFIIYYLWMGVLRNISSFPITLLLSDLYCNKTFTRIFNSLGNQLHVNDLTQKALDGYQAI